MNKRLLTYVHFFAFMLFMLIFVSPSVIASEKKLVAENGGVDSIATTSSVDLFWDLIGDQFSVSYYDSKGNKIGEKLVDVNETQITNLEENKSYSFVIKSEEDQTFAFASTSKGTQPSRIGAVALDAGATVIWEAVPDAIGYELYISESENGKYIKLDANLTTTSANVYNLNNDITYFFKVRAIFNKVDKDFNTISLLSGQKNNIILPTSVTPGVVSNVYVNNFRSITRGYEVHFSWDAVPQAKSYNLKHSKDDNSYNTVINTPFNNYIMDLPVMFEYFKVAAVLSNNSEGPLSQRIKLRFSNTPQWQISADIGSITVRNANYSVYDKVELYCLGEKESEWVTAELPQGLYTLNWLKGGINYNCKLKVTLKGITSESDTKTVYVLPYPESTELTSVNLWDDNAELTWSSVEGTKYNLYLQANNGKINLIAKDLLANSGNLSTYEINNLQCNANYKIYIEANGRYTGTKIFSTSEFRLDSFYCANNRYKFRKLKPAGIIPPEEMMVYLGSGYSMSECTLSAISSIVYNNKIYFVTLDGIYTFNPAYGTDGLWTKIRSEPIRKASTIAVHDDKLYIFGGYNRNNEHNREIIIYDLKSNTLTNLPEHTGPYMDWKPAHFINGKLYFPNMSFMEIYNPSNHTWQKEWLKTASYNQIAKAFVINNKLYYKEFDNPTLRIYDPVAKKQSEIEIAGHLGYASAIEYYNDKLYQFGGLIKKYPTSVKEEYYNEFNVFDLVTKNNKKINPIGDVPENTSYAALHSINDVLYMIGGSVFNGNGRDKCTNDIYAFTP